MRKKLLFFVCVSVFVLAALTVGFIVLVCQEPAFYREVARSDTGRTQADARKFVSRVSQLVSDIHNESTWTATFSESQINAWLAEDFKRKHSDRLPQGMSDVRVALKPDRVVVGYRAHLGPIDSIVSVSAQVWVPEPNVVAVKLQHVAAGAIPVPMDYLIARVTEAAGRSGWPIVWKQHEGLPLALVHLPEDADDDTVELAKLILADQCIHVQGNCVPGGSVDHVALQHPTSSDPVGRH